MYLKKLFAFALLLTLPFLALAGTPIIDLTDVALPARLDGGSYTKAEVRKAILLGCRARGWTATDNGTDAIRASILVRSRHFAEVDIPYSTTGYSIVYRASRELDFKAEKRTIHRNYNKWVANLSGTIQRQFGLPDQVP